MESPQLLKDNNQQSNEYVADSSIENPFHDWNLEDDM